MTKMVEFTRDMRPYRKGDRYALPDIVAEEVVQSGDGVIVPSVFDEPAASGSDKAIEQDRLRRLHYRTRGGQFARRK